jgi:Mechanosensitive ion channel, conserved TM helix
MEIFSRWSDALAGVFNQTFDRIAFYLPNLIGAFLLLLIGWVIAHVLRAIATRLTLIGERALASISAGRRILPAGFPMVSAKILGSVVFWVVVLFFLSAATEVLGLNAFTAWLSRIADYLPTVFVGVLIVFAGFLVSKLARELVQAAVTRAGERQRILIGRVVQAGILITAILVGADQIGIRVTFLVILAATACIALVGAVALALSLGAREYVANLIGAHYLRQRYSVGQYVRAAGCEGRILELTETAVILETAEGRASIPAKVFSEQTIVHVVSGKHGG